MGPPRAGLIRVELNRVAPFQADISMTMTFAPQAVEDGTISLELTGPWASGVESVALQGITPEPSEQQAFSDGIVVTFQADPSAKTEVSFSFTAREHLTLEDRATVKGDTVSFSQFVLP